MRRTHSVRIATAANFLSMQFSRSRSASTSFRTLFSFSIPSTSCSMQSKRFARKRNRPSEKKPASFFARGLSHSNSRWSAHLDLLNHSVRIVRLAVLHVLEKADNRIITGLEIDVIVNRLTSTHSRDSAEWHGRRRSLHACLDVLRDVRSL